MRSAWASGHAAEGEKLDSSGDTVEVPTGENQDTVDDCLLVAAQVIRVTSMTVKMGCCNGRAWEKNSEREP
jgi:hypothetical protein